MLQKQMKITKSNTRRTPYQHCCGHDSLDFWNVLTLWHVLFCFHFITPERIIFLFHVNAHLVKSSFQMPLKETLSLIYML